MSNLAIAQSRDRTKFIGGSDAAAILGVSPWKTPVELWQDKVGLSAPEIITPAKQRAFNRGKRLEPVVLEMVLDKLKEQGHDVECIETNKVYQDVEHDFLQCEIDAEFILDGEHINVDMKTVHMFKAKEWGEEGSDDIPIYYSAQFMHGLGITKRNRCLCAALIGYDDVMIYWIERDDETIQAMRNKSVLFWNEHVLKGIPPDPQTFEDLKHLFAKDQGTEIEATSDIAAAITDLRAIKQEMGRLEAEERALKLEIGAYMKDAAILNYDGKPIATWKAQQRRDFQEKQFKLDHPDLAAQYIKESTNRVFRLSGRGK